MIDQRIRDNKPITRDNFNRLLYLHPNMLAIINEKLNELGLEPFDKSYILDLLDRYIAKQELEPDYEFFLKSSAISIIYSYPEFKEDVLSKFNDIDIKNKLSK